MRITHYYNPTSKSAQYMHYDMEHNRGLTIYQAYTNPSTAKVRAWEDIRERYNRQISRYNDKPCITVYVPASMHKNGNMMFMQYEYGSLHIVGASSHFFSTAAIFTDLETGQQYIVKETHCNTYMCEL